MSHVDQRGHNSHHDEALMKELTFTEVNSIEAMAEENGSKVSL